MTMHFDEIYRHVLNESKFRYMTPELNELINRLAKLYVSFYQNPSKQTQKIITFSVSSDPKWKEFYQKRVNRIAVADTFRLKDLETNEIINVKFVVAYGVKERSLGEFNDTKQIMTIFDDHTKDYSLQQIEGIIAHELTHGFQQYKYSSAEYGEQITKIEKGQPFDKDVYYSEPLEYDAITTEFGFAIKKHIEYLQEGIERAKEKITKTILQKRLEKFLYQLKVFIRSEAKAYFEYEELELPHIFKRFEEFLDVIRHNSKLWKTLKNKMTNLYVEVTGEFPA